MNKRVEFSKGHQKKFITDLRAKSKLKWKELASKLEIKEGTLSKSYMFELCSIPYKLFKRIITITNVTEEEILKKFNGKIVDEKFVIGRKVFGERKKILNPIDIKYSNHNLELDTSKINYSRYDIKKNIKLPNKITPELAEEMGMHLGDGFLSNKKYEYRLKGNQNDEKEYYSNFIKPLFKKLYNIEINLKDYGDSFGFETYSKALWEFKTKVLKLKAGKKVYIAKMPDILKVNNPKILGAFIRGLFDTDGCISFKTKYGYNKYYPGIDLSLASKPLIKDTAKILKMLGLNPNVYFNKQGGMIYINGVDAFKRYENLIGWSNPKNLNRIEEWKKRYPKLYGDCSVTVA